MVLGKSEQCPEGVVDPDFYAVDDLHSERVTATEEKQGSFGAQTLIIVMLMTIAIASVCGFFVGYRIARWKLIQEGHRHSSGSSTG
ncbi:unnamed protein product, partial [Gongylonema pulchrum]|uniref:Transmembrane protein n=1 Tax=Gongylonema pulchrum TaxID=637853 RepID=A0A183DMX7_9BILA